MAAGTVSAEEEFTDPSDNTFTDFAGDNLTESDGVLNVVDIETETDIDLITVKDIHNLPDAEGVDDPTIAYIEDEDDYVGVFQE